MDASYKIQRGIHVHLIQFFMCPEFWVHIMEKEQIISGLRSIVGEEQVLTNESSLLEAAKDYIGFRR